MGRTFCLPIPQVNPQNVQEKPQKDPKSDPYLKTRPRPQKTGRADQIHPRLVLNKIPTHSQHIPGSFQTCPTKAQTRTVLDTISALSGHIPEPTSYSLDSSSTQISTHSRHILDHFQTDQFQLDSFSAYTRHIPQPSNSCLNRPISASTRARHILNISGLFLHKMSPKKT